MDKVTIPIGPQHPALEEPEKFMITLEGEKIVGVGVRLGYNHRGIEKACEERTYIQDIYLIERICGICSHSHSTSFISAVEEIAKLDIPKRALYIRALVGELERLHSHLLWLGVLGHQIGLDTLLMYSWRDREIVMDLLAAITGNRVNYGINTIGGVRKDIEKDHIENVLKAMDILEERVKYYKEVLLEEVTLVNRLSGVGKLSTEDALRLGAVGPTARASSVCRDIRSEDPYGIYQELDFKIITDNHNDVYGRGVVRIGELDESVKLIRQILKNLPDTPISVKAPRRIPEGEALFRYEAPRGEDVHYVKSNGTDKPERVKVRAPTLANVVAIESMLKNGYLADVPVAIAAIDPCFSCTDRMVKVVDLDKDKSNMLNWEDLVKYSVNWYKDKGYDFTKIKLK